MSKLEQLFSQQGQSPWLDNLRRGWITDGELNRWIERGVRGITSNPSIFQKAIGQSEDYDEQLGDLVSSGTTVEDAYWDLVTTDIEAALEILRPVHDAHPDDGFVSVEVAPELARDTDGTIASARQLHTTIDEPNLHVKIPGTAEGVPAVEQMVSEGRNINVTLLFSVDRYAEIIEAYLTGLESFDGDLSTVHGVASFFVSRVDTEVDRRLEEIGTEDALALRGKVAVANARAAYGLFLEQFSGPRWDALAARGANPQRPLWASTSTKNDAYPDTLYVDELIGPMTVNTIPDATLADFEDHGTVARTLDTDLDEAQAVLDRAEAAGVDLGAVAATLEDEGVASFAKSFDELLDTLGERVEELRDRGPTGGRVQQLGDPGPDPQRLGYGRSVHGELVVVDDVAGEFAERVIEAFLGRPEDVFTLALSGGETARRCYERLAESGRAQIDWWRVDVYWGDERCVPIDDPDSNYRLGREALLAKVGAVNANYPMRCEEGTDAYHQRIGQLGRLDFVHLGLGTDGHTASLFPDSEGLVTDPGRLVAFNEDPSGANPHRRMTLTYAGIERARTAVVTVSGEDKAEALAAVHAGQDLPATHVRAERLIWLADPPAASKIS